MNMVGLLAQSATNTPAVLVTLELENATAEPGGRTTLRAFAQVNPLIAATAEQIFFWNVDLLSFEPEVALVEAGSLIRSRSDNDSGLGSLGATNGPHLFNIRDSFEKLPGAGINVRVELFSVRVLALSPGTNVFRLRAGSPGSGTTEDFLVLPKDDSDPSFGGSYSNAVVQWIVVNPNSTPPGISIRPVAGGGVRVETTAVAGRRVLIEERVTLSGEASWRPAIESRDVSQPAVLILGSAEGAQRFFRARILQ